MLYNNHTNTIIMLVQNILGVYKVTSTMPPAIVNIGNRQYIAAGGMYEVIADREITLCDISWNKVSADAVTTLATSMHMSSRGNAQYDVALISDGLHTCTCAGYKFHRTCKHINLAIQNARQLCIDVPDLKQQ